MYPRSVESLGGSRSDGGLGTFLEVSVEFPGNCDLELLAVNAVKKSIRSFFLQKAPIPLAILGRTHPSRKPAETASHAPEHLVEISLISFGSWIGPSPTVPEGIWIVPCFRRGETCAPSPRGRPSERPSPEIRQNAQNIELFPDSRLWTEAFFQAPHRVHPRITFEETAGNRRRRSDRDPAPALRSTPLNPNHGSTREPAR